MDILIVDQNLIDAYETKGALTDAFMRAKHGSLGGQSLSPCPVRLFRTAESERRD